MRKTRHPAAWMPFGAGPRSCAGLRFALLQLKMVVAKVLRDFDFQLSDKLTVPLNLVEGATVMPADGVELSALRRASAMSELGCLRRMSSVLTIAEMAGVNVGSRRTSLAATESDVESENNASEDEEMDMDANWRSYLARRRSSRRSSILDDEPTQESILDIRRASITKGIEMLQVKSIHKGINLMRRASCGTVLEKSVRAGTRRSSLTVPQETRQGTDDGDKKLVVPKIVLPSKPQEPTATMSNFLRSRSGKRRASALPDLESVTEFNTLTEFSPRQESLNDVCSQTVDSLPIISSFDPCKSPGMCSRLYQRRASG